MTNANERPYRWIEKRQKNVYCNNKERERERKGVNRAERNVAVVLRIVLNIYLYERT